MLDIDNEIFCRPSMFNDPGGIRRGLFNTLQLQLATGKILILDIDDDNSAITLGVNPFQYWFPGRLRLGNEASKPVLETLI